MMEILLIRHGQTQGNREKRYVGGGTDEPLCPEGRSALAALPVDEGLEQVFVSPQRRAGQTAAILFPNACQTAVEALREMDFGRFEGKNYLDLAQDRDYRAWVDGGCQGRCPGGESREEFEERTCRAFAGLVGRALEEGRDRLVLVAHGGTAMAVGSRFVRPRRDYFDWQIKNGAALRLRLTPDRWQADRELTVEE